ncbi:MAG: hypothetical protein ABI621_06160 [Chloroflexota bacterium]
MIHLLKEKATPEQVHEGMLKIVVNIRPRLGNRNILIQDECLRKQVESVTGELLGDIQ